MVLGAAVEAETGVRGMHSGLRLPLGRLRSAFGNAAVTEHGARRVHPAPRPRVAVRIPAVVVVSEALWARRMEPSFEIH